MTPEGNVTNIPDDIPIYPRYTTIVLGLMPIFMLKTC
jgi:hypothetical protein